MQERIHCRTALVRKHILDHALCEICANDDETADHIIFGCAFVREVWVRLGWDPSKMRRPMSYGVQRRRHECTAQLPTLSFFSAAGKFGNTATKSSSGGFR